MFSVVSLFVVFRLVCKSLSSVVFIVGLCACLWSCVFFVVLFSLCESLRPCLFVLICFGL